ncbi:MAG TPA: bacillithiol biosynthesis deacetylase BshB1 [Bacteroidetes bacterium]|nr:bacillithiol biosynthesis deacetylase BshB1 [Bacteroidota bacterium]
MKIDLLAFAAHPDDVELTSCGTLMRHKDLGYKIGIVDLTAGQLGTRGTAESRAEEAAAAAEILGLDVRENLGMEDGFFVNDKAHQLKVIEAIRAYKPEVVFCNAIRDRHIDHGKGSALVSDSCFLSGLVKIETFRNGVKQEPWRPKAVYHYIQDRYIEPDFVVDITAYYERKVAAIQAFKTQFYTGSSDLPETPISSKDFLDFLEGRARDFGRSIGVTFAEGFTVERTPGVGNVFDLE